MFLTIFRRWTSGARARRHLAEVGNAQPRGTPHPYRRDNHVHWHRRTADYVRGSGSAFVILRNGWYLENYTDQLPIITRYHALLGSAHDGRVSAASRRDYAAAAAAVLTQDGHLGATYELGGAPFTLTELAATISDVLGTHIAYQDMSVADYTA